MDGPAAGMLLFSLRSDFLDRLRLIAGCVAECRGLIQISIPLLRDFRPSRDEPTCLRFYVCLELSLLILPCWVEVTLAHSPLRFGFGNESSMLVASLSSLTSIGMIQTWLASRQSDELLEQ